eukprot:g5950.t1
MSSSKNRPYRDLTTQFLDRRGRKRSRSFNVIRSGSEPTIELSEVVIGVENGPNSRKPPDWISYQTIRLEDFANIDFTIRELEKLHAKKLLPTFDKRAEKRINREIAQKTQEYKKMAKAMQAEIKRLDNTEYRTLEEQNLGSNMVNSLSKKLNDRAVKFASVNRSFVDKMKQLGGGFNGSSGGVGAGGGGGDEGEAKQMAAQDLFVVGGTTLDELQERDEDIKAIFKAIKEIAEMFTDLHVLVVEQGTILDRVDYNLEVAMTRTFKGNDHLKKAVEHNKKAGSRTLWCTFVLAMLNTTSLVAFMLSRN